MSSSPPTDVRHASSARWRNPAGWSLRGQLVAAMIVLLGLTCLIVGTTTELTLSKGLYDRIDSQLDAAASRSHGFDGSRDAPGGLDDHRQLSSDCLENPPPNFPQGQIIGTLVARICHGALEKPKVLPELGATAQEVPADAYAYLTALKPGADPKTVNLGDVLGDYRVIANSFPDGSVLITGIPLKDAQRLLYQVAAVVAGATLLALLVVGIGGTAVVRRTLRPLQRVAATATRVSELELDRGRVDLAQRVPVGDTDARTEVGQVGAALNKLLDHVRNALEARHASEMQVRQFVADASHELRTPLAAIRGYAELSRRSRQPVPEEVAHMLLRVESAARRMTVLVEDLLLLARLDAGRPLAQDPVDLTVLVVDAVGDAYAAGPRHVWQLDLPDEPVTVIGDGARLHQVLANLLANVRTHTPEGTNVTVGVSATDDAAILRVVDGGPGVPAELQPHIFERFARGDSSRSRAAGSTGLGLSIVHAVVTAHGGRVTVASQPGWTQFTVLLPRVPQPRPARSADAVQQNFAQIVQ